MATIKLATASGIVEVEAVDNGDGTFTMVSAGIGSPDDEAWDGVAAEASVISLLKKIALNTEPA